MSDSEEYSRVHLSQEMRIDASALIPSGERLNRWADQVEELEAERDRLREEMQKAYNALLGEAGGGVAAKILCRAMKVTNKKSTS